MAEMLLLNPRRRRKARKANPAKKRAGRAARRTVRRRNPLPMFGRVRRAARRVARRRRNPIGMGRLTGSSIITAIKDAAIAAGGAVAFDFAYARIAPMLPAALRPTAKVGAGDAVKMLLTIMAGRALRGPTRGLSMKLATGALTVQAHGVLRKMLPPSMLAGVEFDTLDGFGYYSPAGEIADESNVVGPAIDGYVTGSPLLSGDLGEYTEGSGNVILSGDMGDAFSREGVSNYR